MIPVSVIGAGKMGRLHARAVAQHPETQLVAVHDRHAERAQRLEAEFGARAGKPPELVIVATPVHSHVAVAQEHLSNAWVMVEKPLADSVALASPLQHPRCLASLTERYHPALRGRGGPLHTVETTRCGPSTGRGADTDVVFDLLVHDLDLLRSWCGPLRVSEACGVRGSHGRLDEVWAKVRWEGGGGSVHASRVAPESSRRIVLDGEPVDLLAAHDGRDALGAQLDAVVAHIRGEGSAITATEALLSLAIAEAVRDAVAA